LLQGGRRCYKDANERRRRCYVRAAVVLPSAGAVLPSAVGDATKGRRRCYVRPAAVLRSAGGDATKGRRRCYKRSAAVLQAVSGGTLARFAAGTERRGRWVSMVEIAGGLVPVLPSQAMCAISLCGERGEKEKEGNMYLTCGKRGRRGIGSPDPPGDAQHCPKPNQKLSSSPN
jgi:hypothetical protein